MENKKLLVSFLSILAALFVVSTVSAAYTFDHVEVENQILDVHGSADENLVTVDTGETVTVEVYFLSDDYDRDVTVRVELDGEDVDVSAETKPFSVLANQSVRKVLTLNIPEELKDLLFDDEATLEVEIDGDDSSKTEVYDLIIKRTDFNIAVKSVTTPQTVSAGETFPVEIVLENVGFEDLDNLYVTASIKSLGISQSGFFGDIVAFENCDEDDDLIDGNDDNAGDIDRNCDEDDEDTVVGKIFLKVPYGAKAGTYAVEVMVENDDLSETETDQIVIENDFDETVFKSGNSVWLVNPTDNVVGYRLVAESPASVSESIVFVPAGGSKSVSVEPNADGEYDFDVNVFTTKGELVETINFSGSAAAGTSDDNSGTSPVVILTVILAIIFVVLLVVLIVLIGKKPEKSGEFGESYY